MSWVSEGKCIIETRLDQHCCPKASSLDTDLVDELRLSANLCLSPEVVTAHYIMLLPSRPKVHEHTTVRMPCMTADVHLASHSPLCKRQCQQHQFRRMRTAGRASGVQLRCSAEVAEADVGPSTSSETSAIVDFDSEASTTEVPTSDIWELDFSSRPILDSRGKKRWELLITSPDRSWVYSKWFPNNKINSTQVCITSCYILVTSIYQSGVYSRHHIATHTPQQVPL